MPIREVPAGLTAEQAAIVASQAAYQAQQQQLRLQLAAVLAQLWVGVAAAQTFSPQAAAKFVASILPVSLGAQRAMAAITVAQLNNDYRPTTPIIVPPASVSGEALRGRDPSDYYERPFREVKYRLAQGKTLGEALAAGQRRADSIVRTDLELAHTHTARSYVRRAQERRQRQLDDWRARPRPTRGPAPTISPKGAITGYRRVLSSNPNHCALCVLASTRLYHREELMPIHPGCGCTVGFVYSTDDRSDQAVLDPSLAQEVHNIVRRDLGDSYVDAGARLGDAHYRDIVIVNDHGELGPVLGVRGQHFERDPGRPGRLTHDRINPLPEAPDAVQDLDD